MKDMFRSIKENEKIQGFVKELSQYLENNIKHNLENRGEEKLPIIESLIQKNTLATANENAIRFGERDVIIEYANKNRDMEPLYFVKDSKKTYWENNQRKYNEDVYTVFEVQNGEIQELEINKQDMPKGIQVNDVCYKENGEYVVDAIATKEMQEAVRHMAQDIINEQGNHLNTYRKEGHEYLVTEELGNNRFVKDITEDTKTEFEEVNIPKEILKEATEGAILRYINGNYEIKKEN